MRSPHETTLSQSAATHPEINAALAVTSHKTRNRFIIHLSNEDGNPSFMRKGVRMQSVNESAGCGLPYNHRRVGVASLDPRMKQCRNQR
jgi:hypothetical protein